MAEEKGYQGWKNYETWAVALWINNEQNSQEYWQEAARDAYAEAEHDENRRQGIWTREEAATYALADRLENEFEEGQPEMENGVYQDLLTAALDEVDWDEVAESFLNEVEKDEAEDEDED